MVFISSQSLLLVEDAFNEQSLVVELTGSRTGYFDQRLAILRYAR
jgi:hypothetical protein